MQIKSLRVKSYRSWCVADNASQQAIQRLNKLELYQKLKQEGCSEPLRLQSIGCSRATYYRWLKRYQQQGLQGLEPTSSQPRRVRTPQWTKQQEQSVLHLRKRYPLWGKRKCWAVLKRDQGLTLSVSTVGRILAKLISRGSIKPAAFYYGRVKPKQRRTFHHHAKRWRYGMKAHRVGQLIQIDHMSVSLTSDFAIKEFKATCPYTGMSFLRAYSRATSLCAKAFLDYLIQQAPFPLQSIQVDGGSEFMRDFETACQAKGIDLFVLPPKKPQYNGCVERANGTSRYEFYPFYQGSLTIAALNRELENYQWTYNHYRPHDSLDLMTPMAYYQQLTEAA